MNVDDKELKGILHHYKKFCVVGLSPSHEKPSFSVPLLFKNKGWDIVGVYPKPHNEGGFKIYSELKDVPLENRRMIDVFLAPKRIPDLVDEVIALGGTEVLWLQLGITHPEAEAKAEKAGIKVVSDRCIAIVEGAH